MSQIDNICHPQHVIFDGRRVGCNQCRIVLNEDINDFLANLKPHFSLFFGQLYANRTGDLHLKCKIPIENIPGLLPTREVFVKYDTLIQVVRLLGMMNKPFVAYADAGNMFDQNSTLNVKIVESFLERFQTLIERESEQKCDDNDEETAAAKRQIVKVLEAVHLYVNKTSGDSNVIEQFCNVYAPYAWSFDPTPTIERNLTDPNCIVSVLRQVTGDTREVRQRYGPYSLQFEIIYVMVFVLLFSDEVEAIISLVFRLVAQVCCGFFVQPLREPGQRILLNRLKAVRNSTALQAKVKTLQTGKCRDYISVELMQDLKRLHELFADDFNAFWCKRTTRIHSEKVTTYAQMQAFPCLLFADDAQYYGFALAMPLLLKHYDKKNNVLQKSVTGRAKSLIDVVENFVYRMKAFVADDMSDGEIYWDSHLFKLFLGSDEKLNVQIRDILEYFTTYLPEKAV